MADLFYELDMLNIATALTMGVIAIIAIGYTIYCVSRKIPRKYFTIPMMVILAGTVGLGFYVYSENETIINNANQDLKEYYEVSLVNKEIDYAKYDSTTYVSNPLIVTREDDERLYEVFIIKKGDTTALYVKNATGTFVAVEDNTQTINPDYDAQSV